MRTDFSCDICKSQSMLSMWPKFQLVICWECYHDKSNRNQWLQKNRKDVWQEGET